MAMVLSDKNYITAPINVPVEDDSCYQHADLIRPVRWTCPPSDRTIRTGSLRTLLFFAIESFCYRAQQ